MENISHVDDDSQTAPIWKTAPMLIGATKFEPRPDVRNIMVTGGAGFIASWVVRHLVLTYPDAYRIISFDKMDYCSSAHNTAALARPNLTTCVGDVTRPDDVLGCMAAHAVDTVLHFAAQSHVDLSFGNSYAFTHTNVLGTHVLLECAKKMGVGRFVHVSTDEVYGEVEQDEDEEDDGDDGDGGGRHEASLLAPTNPYAASKAAAEMMVQSYQKSFRLPCIIVRSNNVYGPHQYPEKIIPKFICLLNRRRPVVLHGDGTPTRRYLYAADAADAFDTILHRGQTGQVYNVSSSDEVSNLDLCAHLLSATGVLDATALPHDHDREQQRRRRQDALRTWVKYTHDRPFNDCRYAVDGSKLRRLGWRQRTSLGHGLRVTADWYRRFGEVWWGDISHVLTPFPVVAGGAVVPDLDHGARDAPLSLNDENGN